MSLFEITAVALAVAIPVVWSANALFAYRKQRRRAAWDRHVDAALALGQRRPQDSLNDVRWPT